jgi:hypothetical protein
MPNSIRHDFHSDMASIVNSEIQYSRSNYYYFLGKVESWGVNDFAPNTIQIDSDLENSLTRANALFIRKIMPNDVSLVALRNEWTVSTVYEPWDHTKNMEGTLFYCITDSNDVYKCLNNNNDAPSTVKPTGQSFYTFYTSDGYLWKYMYNVPAFKRARFMTSTYIPVQKALSNSFYNKGSADGVSVTASGSGYADIQLTFVNVSGTTTGSGATGNILVGATGNILSINITSGGSGYTAGVSVAFDTATGSGAVGTAIIVGGVITGLSITSSGVGYVAGESILFTVGGAVVVPIVSRVTGSITGLKLVNGGAGYTTTPTLTVTSNNGFASGMYGNPTAQVQATLYLGSIVSVFIKDPGILYPADTSTSIVVQGDGSGAVFSPVVYLGTLVDVVIENPGFGYTSMKLTVIGTGTGAILSPIISSSDYLSNQSIVEQTAIKGTVHHIVVTAPGNNYTSSAKVNVVGDGSGCIASPVIENGEVKSITVTSFGLNYTYVNIIISDINRTFIGNQVSATAYAVLPPLNGHGYDAVSELYGNTLAINSSLRQEVALNKLSQDYRQFGILKNPNKIFTESKFNEASTVIAYTLTFDTVNGLVLDEVMQYSGVKFRVVSWSGNEVTMQQLGMQQTTPIGTFVAETDGARTYSSTSIVSAPTVNKYSGKLLYVSNENPFSFTEEQGIVIKTFLKF